MVLRTRKAAEIIMSVLVVGGRFALWRDRVWHRIFWEVVEQLVWKYIEELLMRFITAGRVLWTIAVRHNSSLRVTESCVSHMILETSC
jgi:tRNA G10  N-methylase Trm11